MLKLNVRSSTSKIKSTRRIKIEIYFATKCTASYKFNHQIYIVKAQEKQRDQALMVWSKWLGNREVESLLAEKSCASKTVHSLYWLNIFYPEPMSLLKLHLLVSQFSVNVNYE